MTRQTPEYLAPEMVAEPDVGAAAAHGHLRSRGDPVSDADWAGAVRGQDGGGGAGADSRRIEPAPLSRFNREVTPNLEAFCLRCLRKNPWRRYSRTFDVLKKLREFQDNPEGNKPGERDSALAASGGIAASASAKLVTSSRPPRRRKQCASSRARSPRTPSSGGVLEEPADVRNLRHQRQGAERVVSFQPPSTTVPPSGTTTVFTIDCVRKFGRFEELREGNRLTAAIRPRRPAGSSR